MNMGWGTATGFLWNRRKAATTGKVKTMALLNVGDVAPAFELSNQDGQMVRLADLAGKHVVFWFYPRASTPG